MARLVESTLREEPTEDLTDPASEELLEGEEGRGKPKDELRRSTEPTEPIRERNVLGLRVSADMTSRIE